MVVKGFETQNDLTSCFKIELNNELMKMCFTKSYENSNTLECKIGLNVCHVVQYS